MLRLTLFGGFTLVGPDDVAVVIASRKCRALLAFLALQARPVPRDRLAGLLWGDGGEARARGSLRQALMTLRRDVPGDDDWLAASAEAVAVDRPALWVDAVQAEELLAAGEPGRALELCGRGELLAGLTVGAEEFDDWAASERHRWRERETAALQGLAAKARRTGQNRELLSLGRRLLKLEPWNEEAHRMVMQALAALGRHSEALRQYRLAAEALRVELGVAPGPETEGLLVQIRSQRVAAPGSGAVAASPEIPDAPGPDEYQPSRPGDPTRDATAAPAARPGRLVGRELEGSQLEGLLQGCRSSGRGHVILIRGEAGIGKTTFLRRALESVGDSGFATHLVQAAEYGGGRNADVVRGVLGALDPAAHTPARHRLAVDELLGRPLGADAGALAAALDPEARAQAHLRAVEDLVAAAGAQQPRIIAVDDVHWCDPETIRLLCALAGAGPQHRLVTIFTCRSGEEPRDLAWAALVRRGSLTSIDLGPLPPRDAVRLAAEYPDRDAELTRRCIERAAGHPLFLVQLLESGADGEAVPDSVQSAVVARLDRVSPADRRMLNAAAVLGSSFTVDQMARLLEPDTVDATALVQQGWLRPDGARLTIAHDLVAAAIRSALDGPSLNRLHRWAAGCFADQDPLTSAEHLQRAGDPGAAPAYLSIARDALGERRLDLAEAVLERVDACAPETGLAFEAVCLRGDVRRERGDAAGSHAVFARAAGHARSPEQRARARLGLAAALRLLDRHDEALACLQEIDVEMRPDDHATCAQVEQLRGNLLFVRGDLAGCRDAHQRALTHARLAESASDEAGALSGLGDAHYLEGRLTSARQAFEACLQLARTHGILRMEGASSMMLGTILIYTDLAAAMATTETALAVAARIVDPRLQSLAEVVAAGIRRAECAWAAAREHGERAQAAARRLGSERLESLALNSVGRALLGEGRRREALVPLRQALTLCQRSGGLPLIGGSILAALALLEQDPEAARATLAQAEAHLTAGSPCHNHFDVREAGIARALGRGEWDEVRRHADALEAYVKDEQPPYAALIIERARLLIELGTDPSSVRARERLDELRAGAERIGLTAFARSVRDTTFTPP